MIQSRFIELHLLGRMLEGAHRQAHTVQKCLRVMQFHHSQDSEPLVLVLSLD